MPAPAPSAPATCTPPPRKEPTPGTATRSSSPHERYATTAEDWNACLDSTPALTALGVGTTYAIHALSEPAEDGALRWMVTYKPTGPASLRAVVVAESVSWTAACDLVRDAVAEQLADEGCSL